MKTYRAKTSDGKIVTFPSENREAAEAYCLMHDLEIQESRNQNQETSEPSYYKGNALLSKKQKAVICQLAAAVFNDLDKMGLIEAEGKTKAQRLTNWRRDQVKKSVGQDSLTTCRNDHYRRISDWFSSLTGVDYTKHGNPQHKCTGPQTNQRGDTMERREQLIKLIEQDLNEHLRVCQDPKGMKEIAASQVADVKGGPIGEGYLMSIAKAKNARAGLSDMASLITLPAAKLEQLHFTLRNRIAAREGRGTPSSRNKRQRGE